MQNDRLPKKAYLMMYDYDLKGKTAFNWITKVRMFLSQNGFGYVWANQGVGDVKGFLHALKERLIDCRWQNCDKHVNTVKDLVCTGHLCHHCTLCQRICN